MDKTDIHLHLSLTGETIGQGMYIATPEEILPHLDRLGIVRGVVLSTDEARGNAAGREIAARYPGRFAWMCAIDPVSPETVLERLARCQAEGAIGVGELVINQRLDKPFLQTLFAAAERLRLPVLFHMSPEEGFSYGIVDEPGLPLLEAALRQYPDLVFIGHSQAFWHEVTGDASPRREDRNSWGQGPVAPGGRLTELFSLYPNLRGDLSANSGGRAIMRDEAFGLAFLDRFQDQLMFGSDMPNADTTYPLGAWLDEQLARGTLSPTVYDKICRENARKLFGL